MTLRTLSLNPLRVGLISGLAVAGLLLSGCAGGEPQGSGTQSPSVSESSRTTTTPTATPSAAYKPASATGKAENVPVPVLPEEAKKETKEGLEAFARYWYSALSYAFETGDLSQWSDVTATECVFCNNIRAGTETGYKLGRWQVGGRLSVPSVEPRFTAGAASQQVIVQVIQEETQYFKADGSVGRNPEPASNSASVVVARYGDGRWTVSDLHLLQ